MVSILVVRSEEEKEDKDGYKASGEGDRMNQAATREWNRKQEDNRAMVKET